MRGLDPIGANLRRIISLSVVIVRACGRSSKHGTSHLARLSRDYWVPRLKRGMTRERFVTRLKLAPMGIDPRIHLLAKEDGLHRTSGLPEVRTSTECRKPGIPGLRVKPRQ